MGKKKPSKEQKEEVSMRRYLDPIWKQIDECMAELRAEEEAELLKKEAEEARAAERVRVNKEEAESRIEEMVEEESKKKT